MKKQQMGVIGAGLMGVGIALRYALKGHGVMLYDAYPEQLARIPATVHDICAELLDAHAITQAEADAALARIVPASSLDALRDVALVIEAIPEQLELKRRLYAELEARLSPQAVIGSNTSGLMPAVLADTMAHPERFLIIHFWNPPHVIPLVELVPGPRTAAQHVRAAEAQLRAIGMQPVVLRHAIPGFVGNRIQFAVLREALHILRSGAADASEIDLVVQETLGRRYHFVGPLAGADLGGLNTFAMIAAHLMPELAKDEGVIDLLQQRVARGELGARSGQGFHLWDAARHDEVRQRRRELLEQKRLERKRPERKATPAP
jgi:3-hydroxybutyryl-CoA dehydrogenase